MKWHEMAQMWVNQGFCEETELTKKVSRGMFPGHVCVCAGYVLPTAHRDRAKWAKWATPCVTVRMDSRRVVLRHTKTAPLSPRSGLSA